VTQVFAVLTSMPPVGGKPGPKRQKPERLQGDTGYDSEPVRRLLRWLGITPILGQRGREHGSGLGAYRWFVECFAAAGGAVQVVVELPLSEDSGVPEVTT
jgi:hypothetical protein